jgi:hypothetical protein
MGDVNCTIPAVVKQKNIIRSPAGPGNRNDCAGEDQQQFTRPDSMLVVTE